VDWLIPPTIGAKCFMKRSRDHTLGALVDRWTKKAAIDLNAARTLLSMECNDYFAPAFHSQQAAEKYLKSLLTLRQIPFGKTRDIGKLIMEAWIEHGEKSMLWPARRLTRYAVTFRYPSRRLVKKSDAVKAVKLADAVARYVKDQIEGRDTLWNGNKNSGKGPANG